MAGENKKIGSHNKLATLLSFLIALNVFDAIMTLIWTHYSIAEEANPLMLYLLEIHPVLFLFIKITLVFLGVGLLWRMRQFKPVLYTAYFLNAAYIFLAFIHINILVRWAGLL